MDPILLAEQLARLQPAEIDELREKIRAHARALRDGQLENVDPDDVEALSALRDAMNILDDQLADPGAGAPSPPAPGSAPVEEEIPAAASATPAPAPRPSLAQLSRNRPAHAEPQQTAHTRPRWQLEHGTTADLGDLPAIAERMIAARASFGTIPSGLVDRVTVASIKLDRPPEMVLASDDAYANMAKIEAVTAAGKNPDLWTDEQRAIVASGGWAAPAEARYTLPNISSAARPFRDGLPSLGSMRGSVSFVRAARLSSVVTGGPSTENAAITEWEAATDTTPGGNTKQRQTFAPRSIVTHELGAVVARARFGNFHRSAFPEDVAHSLGLVAAAHARIAERRLIDSLIDDLAVDVTQTGFFGTARDLRVHLAQAAMQIRDVERMGDGAPIRAFLHRTAPAMAAADVVNQTASGSIDALLVDDARARAIIAASGVNVSYVMDTPTGADAFVTNSIGENLADFPDNFEVPIIPDGHAVFVDGGELNLGLVRDSTLNGTNDFEVFFETFEGLLWLGPFGLTLTLTTCPNGTSQAAASVSNICSGS